MVDLTPIGASTMDYASKLADYGVLGIAVIILSTVIFVSGRWLVRRVFEPAIAAHLALVASLQTQQAAIVEAMRIHSIKDDEILVKIVENQNILVSLVRERK